MYQTFLVPALERIVSREKIGDENARVIIQEFMKKICLSGFCVFENDMFSVWVVLENNNEHLKQPSEWPLACPLAPLPAKTSSGFCRWEVLAVPGSADG